MCAAYPRRAVGSDAEGAAASTRAWCVRGSGASVSAAGAGVSALRGARVQRRRGCCGQRRGGAAGRGEGRAVGCEASFWSGSTPYRGVDPKPMRGSRRGSERCSRADGGTGRVPKSASAQLRWSTRQRVCVSKLQSIDTTGLMPCACRGERERLTFDGAQDKECCQRREAERAQNAEEIPERLDFGRDVSVSADSGCSTLRVELERE